MNCDLAQLRFTGSFLANQDSHVGMQPCASASKLGFLSWGGCNPRPGPASAAGPERHPRPEPRQEAWGPSPGPLSGGAGSAPPARGDGRRGSGCCQVLPARAARSHASAGSSLMARGPSQAGRRMVVPLPRPDGPRRAAAH